MHRLHCGPKLCGTELKANLIQHKKSLPKNKGIFFWDFETNFTIFPIWDGAKISDIIFVFFLSDGPYFCFVRHEPVGICGQIIPVSLLH